MLDENKSEILNDDLILKRQWRGGMGKRVSKSFTGFGNRMVVRTCFFNVRIKMEEGFVYFRKY